MKFVVESHKGVRIHGYDAGYINLVIPSQLQPQLQTHADELAYNPET